jgi:vitamin B12 transporter
MEKSVEGQSCAVLRRAFVVAVCAAGGWVSGAHAQGSAPVAAAALDRIIISGSLTEATLADTGSAVTVITAEELEQRQIRFVSDALRAVPGVAVNRLGPTGAVTQVRIRGAEGNHTVVRIDGIKINDPFTSEVDFAHVLTAEIDRIEILRGPQSVLYGSEAIGGVISIFTKRGVPGVQLDASVEAGSFSTFSGSAAVRGATPTVNYALSATALNTDGTNVSRFGSEDDGYRNRKVYARVGWTPTSAMSLNASLGYRDSRSMFDPQDFGFPPGPTFGLIIDGNRQSDGDQLDAMVRGRLTLGQFEHQLGFAGTRTEEDTFADGVFSNGFAGNRTQLGYQGSWRFGAANMPQTLTLVAEHERQAFESKGPTPVSAQNQIRDNEKNGFAAEYLVRLPSLTALTLSARRDNNELFEDATTYRITAAQPIGERVKLRASYGTGFANPTFFELFGFIAGSFDSNPDLKPEISRGFDIGADFAICTGQLSVTYFNADLSDEIVGTFDSTTFRSSVANLPGKSKRRGAEIEARYAATEDIDVWFTYTYTDSTQSDGQREVRRPTHIGSVAVNYSFAGARGGVTLAVDYNGRQEDLDFRSLTSARVVLREYTLVRLAGQYAITRNVNLTARVENLLDQDYEEVFSYRPSGRAFYAGLQARF